MTQNDKQIFREIKDDIRKNPTEYQPAGQWLDDLLKNKQGFIRPMSKAFKEASCEYPRNYRKILLITWLLTDEYLHKSKIGITKYEQYVFKHEIIEPEGDGLKRTISEQELARDAVLYSNPEAIEIVRDAYEQVVGQSESSLFRHNEDYTTVWHGGETYTFNKPQARCIKYLHKNISAFESSIGECLGSAADNFRLIQVFRNKKAGGYHPAWGKLVISEKKGVFTLNRVPKNFTKK